EYHRKRFHRSARLFVAVVCNCTLPEFFRVGRRVTFRPSPNPVLRAPMKAVCWYGKQDVRVENVPDPKIQDPRDAILRITTTAICGSDLHLYGGFIPEMRKGDVLGHEFMGEVVEAGAGSTLKKGDRVVVPFDISCGECWYCKRTLFSLCQNSNPDAEKLSKLYGYAGAGLFGYSHLYGGYPGGQAEYVRVPFSDVGPIKVPDSLSDEQVL